MPVQLPLQIRDTGGRIDWLAVWVSEENKPSLTACRSLGTQVDGLIG